MPLSISSSNSRIPPAPYGKLWLLALCFILLFAAGAELILRDRGHLKSVTDNDVLWGMEVDKIRSGEVDVALVGASRMQLGLQVDRFQDKTGLRAANLTIDGCSPIPVLGYIAEETAFSGLLLVSLSPPHILDDDLYAKSTQQIQRYEQMFSGAKKYNPILNRHILNILQSHFVFFSANTGFWIIQRINKPIHINMTPDRSRQGYYREILSKKSLDEVRENRLVRVRRRPEGWSDEVLMEKWRLKVANVSVYVKQIQDRGGRVIFVRFPTTGEYGQISDAEYPREICWDLISDLTGAKTMHFKDYQEASELKCPEGSHLNYGDSLKMTDLLIDHILE